MFQGRTAPILALKDNTGVRVWDDEGSGATRNLKVYKPGLPGGSWFALGHRAQPNYSKTIRSHTHI